MKKPLLIYFILFHQNLFADQWVQKADFGGTARAGCTLFSIGNKGYIGLGTATPIYTFKNDLWEYDATNDTWTQKANYPGAARYTVLSFTIGTKAYVGTGWNGSYLKDMWQYDQTTNTWSAKNNFPGSARNGAIAVMINNKVYAGLGASSSAFLTDFYGYNDTTDVWTAVASFPAVGRDLPFVFGINGKAYVGAGVVSPSATTYVSDMWEYDATADSWTRKADFPGSSRFAFAYFSINDRGYAGLGKTTTQNFSDFYKYIPLTDTWQQVTSCPDTNLESGFTIGQYGYTGCGGTAGSTVLNNKFWQYVPDSLVSISEIMDSKIQFGIYPNPSNGDFKINLAINIRGGELTIYNSIGQTIVHHVLNSVSETSVIIATPGIYFVKLRTEENESTQKVVIR